MSATVALDLIPVRAVNQVTYCPRLYFLEYVEGLMTNNAHVEDGLFAEQIRGAGFEGEDFKTYWDSSSDRGRVEIATVDFQNLRWHPAFTSKKRIYDYIKEPEVCLGAAARNLFEMLPGSNFWLNPLSECQKPLPATEIALLMSGKIFDIAMKSAR